ncbi:MAG: PepSY domain-containing protein [Candidatus Izemoplasma sp.]
MKNKDIEKAIYETFNENKPELFSKILEQCPNMTEDTITDSIWNKFRKSFRQKRFVYSFSSLSLILVFAVILFSQPSNVNAAPFSVIAIDVNPSVILELDEEDKVINVIKNNEDAEIIVGDMDLIGIDYNVAVNALIGSMVTNGYINELTNSVLLSIQSNSQVRESELMAELSVAINDVLTGNGLEGSVITQQLDFAEDAEELSELLDISEAKAELILDIIELDPRVTVEELAQLSINDLNLLLESNNYTLYNVDKIGKASELGIISIAEAYQIALTELGLDELSIIEFEVDLGQEDGTMVYEIDLETATDEYEIIIDAKTGAIFSEFNGNDDEDDDENFPTNALTEAAVLALVLSELGIDSSSIIELDIESEMDNGVAYYEISFEYADQEYDLEVDALTGLIYTNSMDETGFDYDDEDEEEEDLSEDDN